MSVELMVVQFPHPGVEHQPRGSAMDWNRHEHARKFLRACGRYLSGGAVQSGPFAFWGEWEPQSQVVEAYPAVAGHPRWLHDPFWQLPRHRRLLQNTDPLVFGDRFLYSNCRQRRNSKLRRLAPGSLVLFGSKFDGSFVLDTVFVVADRESFSRASGPRAARDEWVDAVVFEPLRQASGPAEETFQLYRGRTFRDAPNGPFSFVPCRPYQPGEAAFARPVLNLDPRWVAPKLAMGAKATEASPGEIRSVWEAVVAKTTEVAGLALGIKLDPPRHRTSPPTTYCGPRV